MTDAPKILPCPFCGDDMSSMGAADSDAYFAKCSDGTLAVQCSECNSTGPFRGNRAGAMRAWNTRASLDALLHKARIEGARAMLYAAGQTINSGLGRPAHRIQQDIMALEPEQVVQGDD